MKNKSKLLCSLSKDYENLESKLQRKILLSNMNCIEFYFVLQSVFPLQLGQMLLLDLQNLWQFWTPDGEGCWKRPWWKFSAHCRLRKCQMKSVKSFFAGHSVANCIWLTEYEFVLNLLRYGQNSHAASHK